nr:MAG TPA: hypothetical protein [Caudoviricetes sp.]DAX00451.1 MAG TPA: hypothetical protein [Bacteriophage sp.]
MYYIQKSNRLAILICLIIPYFLLIYSYHAT